MVIKIASADSLIIYFEQNISLDTSLKVKSAYEKIKTMEGLIEVIPSYSSILIIYDFFKYDFKTLSNLLEENLRNLQIIDETSCNNIKIEVYYGKEVGLDLERMSKITKHSISEIINLHTSTIYHVYAVGFVPGFAYMGSVDKRIALDRLSTPRKMVPKGSVGIANEQTAVYPFASPGGWNIIGKTPIKLYDKSLEQLSLCQMGDKVQFISITKEKFLSLGGDL